MTQKLIKISLLGAGLLTFSGSVFGAELVTNGGFETFNQAIADGSGASYWTYNTGNAGIAGWTVGGRVGDVSVDIQQNPTYASNSGDFSCDLAGTPGPGSIHQSLATSIGQTYTLSFWGYSTDSAPTVLVDAGPASTSFNLTSSYQQYTFAFTADSTSSVLSLGSLLSDSSNGNIEIDDVSVQAVPEPATMAGLGIGALALIRRRRSKKA